MSEHAVLLDEPKAEEDLLYTESVHGDDACSPDCLRDSISFATTYVCLIITCSVVVVYASLVNATLGFALLLGTFASGLSLGLGFERLFLALLRQLFFFESFLPRAFRVALLFQELLACLLGFEFGAFSRVTVGQQALAILFCSQRLLLRDLAALFSSRGFLLQAQPFRSDQVLVL